MADGSALDELQRKQAETAKFAATMANEKDPEKLAEMAKQVLERCKALESSARRLAANAVEGLAPGGKETRVILTPEQKKRLADETSVGLDAVVLEDEASRLWSKDIATARPHEIERMAARAATASRLQSETKTAVEKIIKQLVALNVPELDEHINELRKHPALQGPASAKKK